MPGTGAVRAHRGPKCQGGKPRQTCNAGKPGDPRRFLRQWGFIGLVGLITFNILPGCSSSEQPVPVFTSQVAETVPVAPENQGLVFAVACEDEPATTYKAYLPLVEYLSRRTGIPISLSIKDSSALVNEMLRSGDAGLARISSGSFIKMDQEVNLDILALESSGGSTSFQGVIIARQDSPCENFAQLRGKSFALVDHMAAAGYDYPLALVRKQGADLDDYFCEVTYSGSHGRSIMAVYYGIVDGAAVASYVLAAQTGRHPEMAGFIKIIGRSSDITRGPLVAGPYLSEEYKSWISAALIGMRDDEQGRQVLQGLGLDAFVSGSVSDFAPNRAISAAAYLEGQDDETSSSPGIQNMETFSHPEGRDVAVPNDPAEQQ